MPDIDDPFEPPPDATVIRPRPGGRTPAAAPDAWPPAASPQPSSPAAAIHPARAWVGPGENLLVDAAGPVLYLAGHLRGTLAAPDLAGLRQQALDEVRRFEERARAAGVASEVVLAARYALCATLDEAILSTPWGAQSAWGQQTLLVSLHREAWGGEKFFEMLDRLAADPDRHLDLLELQYLCLAFGFAGKYRVQEQGAARLVEIQERLARLIRERRGRAPGDLSPRWRGVEDRRNPLVRYVPWWVAGAAALALVAVTFTIAYASLARASAPVSGALARLALEDLTVPVVGVPAAGPRLRDLLAEDVARGAITVEEEGGRTTMTLLAPDLFASASAEVNPVHAETLRRVAAALRQVPGQVRVVGHTDDLPLRSLRFQDNFELSRERAVSVVEIMRPAIDQPGRLEWIGAGSLEPRYEPVSEPANRARNRRVEIVHVPEP